jgi:hypothetical protein
MLPLWFEIIYPLSILLFFSVLYWCSRKYPRDKHYSIFTRTISGLGNKEYESSMPFRVAFLLMPLFNLALIHFLWFLLSKNNLSSISVYFLVAGQVAALGTAFVTEKFSKGIGYWSHYVISIFAFISSIIGFVILSFSLRSLTHLMLFFGFLPLAMGIITAIVFSTNKTHALDVRDPIFQNIPFWEWLTFLSLFICLLIGYVILIIY